MATKQLEETGKSWLRNPAAALPYQHQEYPKRMHHKDKPSVVVNTPAEAAKLGAGWEDSPAAFVEPEPAEASADSVDKAEAEIESARAALQPPVRPRK